MGDQGQATVIRLVRAGDEPGVADCVREVYEEYGFTWDPGGYHADLFDLSQYFDELCGRFWVAESDGKTLGCGGIRRFETIPGPIGEVVSINGKSRIAGTDCEVVRMYVRSEARRKGIGSGIMERIVAHAREWGSSGLEIWSDKRFLEAHRLYRRFGAVVVGERVCDDPDESPEWGLWIKLAF